MLNLETRLMAVIEKGTTQRVLSGLMRASFKNKITRKAFIGALEKAMWRLSFKGPQRPERVHYERALMARALLSSIERTLNSGALSERCMNALWDIFLGKVFIGGIPKRRAFLEEQGFRPPCFVTISPTNVCNLKCKGCYAGDIYTRHTLSFDVFDRAINEIKEHFGAHFLVISGGEPFMYRHSGHTLMDVLEKHNDVYFMAYTNGTMITREVAKKLGQLGNFTPSISVEGFAQETDERRGHSVHRKILEAMEYLREFGVPFGISVTPTRYNADLLLSDEFIDYYFFKQGAFYGWYFQYMPIGRQPSVELMVTPEQRLRMLKRIWSLVEGKRLFIADFWNSGTASDGCMAAARGGGYFYIMWDGTITPCVFIPFKDRTSGKETDPAGRFLYAPAAVDDKVELDFNRAYNPPCAFTPYATCPLPPRQNWLPVRIEAGELTYHAE
ncbi:MAG: DUF1684 domain-containing protein [Candidatus Omnitrophica bacterium]|nr:DUF1684 domain-containing protein [Candidatus Omnitrophota bacterium]